MLVPSGPLSHVTVAGTGVRDSRSFITIFPLLLRGDVHCPAGEKLALRVEENVIIIVF